MYCKNCGRKQEEGELFCTRCGTRYDSATQQDDARAEEKTRDSSWMVFVLVAIICVMVGVVIYLFPGNDGADTVQHHSTPMPACSSGGDTASADLAYSEDDTVAVVSECSKENTVSAVPECVKVAEDVVLPTFLEIREFIYGFDMENNISLPRNLRDKGMHLLAEYDERDKYDALPAEVDGPMMHFIFYGVNAAVECDGSEGNDGYKKSFYKKGEHAVIIGIYRYSDTVPIVYFSNKSDWEKCREQYIAFGDDPYMWEFETAEDSDMKGWYVLYYKQ